MENTIPYHLHCEDNSVVPVLVTPYVKKAKRTCVTVAQRTEIIESATSIETQISQVPELVLHPYQSTTIKKNAPAKFKAQTEINKQQQLQSIREKLGKSKKFQSRDNQVLRLMSEPKLLTKVGPGVPAYKAKEAQEEGMRKVMGLQYRKAYDKLAEIKSKKN